VHGLARNHPFGDFKSNELIADVVSGRWNRAFPLKGCFA